jgi:hypothetical protein
MKVKIIEPGWAGFTGNFGDVEFVDGVSDREVTQREAQRVSNLIRVETVEAEPKNPSASQAAIDNKCLAMFTGMDHVTPASVKAKTWTREELEKLADLDGIKAVRAVADPLGVKGVAIASLIDAILAKQETPAVVESTDPVKSTTPVDMLLGSSVQPSLFQFTPGSVVQLGTIVGAAFMKSGKTVVEWNEQPGEMREQLIAEMVDFYRAEGAKPETLVIFEADAGTKKAEAAPEAPAPEAPAPEAPAAE